ncbi:CAP domain-containing protein [Stagnihabitans tardus]|uniref:CAP domain-containing protein n=1 Tax=Stagnihabitans tardus TaxID=2699202 RepID=A0AAE5BUI7_9RHOB|nr:CAP domain-containing protein [Stagnihabitans tardus]NBZ86839.1 CAP domain-containing protein [Stagnihabitans tardus]
MERRSALLLGAAAALAACGPAPAPAPLGPDGRPLPKVYPIKPGDESAISYRMLDGLNALRQSKGETALAFSAPLIAACATHARDMAVQNRPWHFGSDGSSPLVRAQRVGYTGKLLGELISETYQTELETLADWSAQADTRAVLLDPRATDFGFAWFQEPSGKLWWAAQVGAAV